VEVSRCLRAESFLLNESRILHILGSVFQFRIILWFGLVKRSLFYNGSQNAGFRVQGQSPIISRMCHQAACGVQRNCPLHFEDMNFQPTQKNRLNLTSYILDRRWEDKIASNEQAASHLFPSWDGFKTGPIVLWWVVTDDACIWSSLHSSKGIRCHFHFLRCLFSLYWT
jgi:hypothetical protein